MVQPTLMDECVPGTGDRQAFGAPCRFLRRVWFGLIADVGRASGYVRFAPESGHPPPHQIDGRFCARSGHSLPGPPRLSFDHLVSLGEQRGPMRTSPYLCYYVRPSMSEIIVPTDKPCDLCGARGWIRPINGPSKPCPRCNAVGENIVAPDDDVEPTRVRLGPKRRVRRPRFA